jgi:HEAT repeat protein
VPDGFQQPPPIRLGEMKPVELVAQLEHPNGWHRDTAARLLYERQDRSAIGPLSDLATRSKSPLARMHALHALAGLNSLSEDMLLPRLSDEHPRVREHAVALSEKLLDSAAIRARLVALASDPELRVRYQVAFSLGELPTSIQRNRALAEIAKRDAADGYVRIAVLSSLGEGAGEVLSLLLGDPEYRANKTAAELLGSLATQIGKQQRAEDVAETLKALAMLSKENSPLLAVIVQKLAAKEGSPLAEQIAAATGGKAEAVMHALLTRAASAAGNEAVPMPRRVSAVEQLRLAKFTDQRELLFTLLGPSVPADLQAAALRTLASYDAAEVAELTLSRFAAFSPRLKASH